MTRYFYDTEFLEDGKTIELISIGIVASDGRELYAVNAKAGRGKLYDRIASNKWLMDNVVPSLPLAPGSPVVMPTIFSGGAVSRGFFTFDDSSNVVMPPRMIRNAVRDFLLHDPDAAVELWADYGAYDHVALCQLFGPMIALPEGMPMFTSEFQQAWRARGCPGLPKQEDGEHNALADARHLRDCFDATFRPSERITT